MINVDLEGIDDRDYPDFSDAYICYAEHDDGTPLTDQELEDIPSDVVYDYVISQVF